LRNEKDPLYSEQYSRYYNSTLRSFSQDKRYVLVDAHVLATPVIVDLDKDGHDDVIVPVSYFFDKDVYSDPEVIKNLDVDVDIKKYVASGIAVFDLVTKTLKFQTNLQVTVDNTRFSSYIYGSPTVLDIDGDGWLEIIVAVGSGYVYKINYRGSVVGDGFPLVMDSISAQPVVEDLNDDGSYEIIVCDTNANVVVFSSTGKEIWEARIAGFPHQSPSIGDVDGDGILDVVVGTTEGHIWALNGITGKSVPNFPAKLRGRVENQPLLVKLHEDERKPGLHVVVTAHDGHVYILDGASGCFDKVDIGESSYSMVLVDDVDGNNKMDLVVTTRSGNVFLLGTNAPYHPLRSWTSQNQGRNGFTVRDRYLGIYVTENTRSHRDISGDSFQIQFEIVDVRVGVRSAYYDVTISYGNRDLMYRRYQLPGVYTETLRCPFSRMSTTIFVEMSTEHQQTFYDSITISFNLHFYRLLKWILLIPFLVMAVVLLFIKEIKSPLPTVFQT